MHIFFFYFITMRVGRTKLNRLLTILCFHITFLESQELNYMTIILLLLRRIIPIRNSTKNTRIYKAMPNKRIEKLPEKSELDRTLSLAIEIT